MTRTSIALGVALPLALFVGLTALVIARPGFTPDEEITAVAASAIGSRGLPILPSGVLYPRGVPYLYAAWLVSLVAGKSMLAWRLTSWIFGAVGVVLSYRLGARIGGPAAALFLSLLLATFPPYIAASVFARPYSALIASVLLFAYWLLPSIDRRARTMPESMRSRPSPTGELFSPGRSWPLAAVIAFAVWLHPAGIALAVLPALSAFTFGATRPKPAARLTAMLLLAGIAAAGLAYGAHALSLWSTGLTPTSATAVYAIPTPASPASAHITSLAGLPAWLAAVALFAALGFLLLRRYPDSTAVVAVNLACAVSDQLGLLLLAGFAALAWNPRAARRTATVVLSAGLGAIAFWTLHTSIATHAQLNRALVGSLTAAAASYPLGQLWFAMSSFPVVVVLAVAGTAWALSRPVPDEVHRIVGGVALLTVGLLGSFSVLSVAVAERYLLLPWTLLAILASAGVGALAAAVPGQSARDVSVSAGSALRARAVAVVLVATGGVWAGHATYAKDRDVLVAGSAIEQALAPLTGPSWTPELLRSLVQSDDLLVCTEELACAYLLGRVDFLFALPPRDVAHYAVDRGGAAAGFYAGAPVLSSSADLQRAIQDHDRTGCAVVVALKSGKVGYDEYLAVLEGLPDSFDVRDVLSREDLHVSRVCRSFVNVRLMPRRDP